MSKITRKLVSTKNAAKPVAPYNQAVVVDRTVYVSGCLGLDKETNTLVSGGAAAEMAQALKNVKAILEASGSSIDNVVKTTVFVDDLADFGGVNDEYKKVFLQDFPARSCVQVEKLPANAKVEIELIAVTGNIKTVHN
ncbi:rutC family protein UK114-like [Bradysia coprophila]|uniref:rutC family protein UK114-like n=1 Tax=Bradysia coprophila TaxID=38358 RepID=UPI00187DA252|nr:rutC family protein UK114-like [Bradysia coprophila]